MTAVDLHSECIGSGPPVVVLHGLFGAGRNWLTVARRLSSAFEFHLVDLRNHGRSPHTTSMTYTDMVADVLRMLDQRRLARPIVVGHSMGGKAAMTLAIHHPERLTRLINIDIAPVSYPDRFADMIAAMRTLDLSTIRRRHEADGAMATAIPETQVRQFILQNLVFRDGVAAWRANLATLQEQMPHILGPIPVADNASFDGDTWFIRGERSDRITASEIPVIQRLFPYHQIETVPGGGHWPHAEAPEAFLELFRRALDG